MSKFAAAVGKWASQSKERIDAVYGRSIEMLGAEMSKTKPQGGRVPFLTGTLARSLLADKTGMPGADGSPVGLIASTIKSNESVWLGYTVNYARRLEFGFVGADSAGRVFNQPGNYFVHGAIAEWPQIVRIAVNEIKQGR